MKNKNIIIIRKRLDKLDLSMLSIIKKRNLLVDKILQQKKYKNQIIDKQRIKIILNKIKKEVGEVIWCGDLNVAMTMRDIYNGEKKYPQ